MAIPVAVTNGIQAAAYGDLPKTVNLVGTASFDPDADPITAYSWTLLDKPTGSTAVLATPDAASTDITVDVPGDYLAQLEVTANGEQSDTDALTAPDSSYAVVRATTQHRALTLPASGERGWADVVNGDLATLDALAGTHDAHVADQGAHWPLGDEVDHGALRLEDAPASAVDPIALGPNNPSFTTLTSGSASDADGLHGHPRASRHHVLRPTLLTGDDDKRWTAADVATLTKSSDISGTRTVWAGQDADGLLQLDIAKQADDQLAGVLWPAIAGDFQAVIDLRASFDGDVHLASAAQTIMAGFGWLETSALAIPDELYGGGLAISAGTLAAPSVGLTPGGTAAHDWNADSNAIGSDSAIGGPLDAFLVRLTRSGTTLTVELSRGDGGWVAIGAPFTSVPVTQGYFALFGSMDSATVGLRLKSTGLRITTPDTWFGV